MSFYCEKCFESLNSNDRRKGYDKFLTCKGCNRKYHEIHWSGVCEECQGTEAVAVTIAPSPRASHNHANSLAANRLAPSQLTFANHIDLTQKEDTDHNGRVRIALRLYVRYLIQLICSILVGILLIGISAVVGAFAPQVLAIRSTGVREILDAITEKLPNLLIFLSALVSALGAALVFYHQVAPRQSRQWFERLLTALIIIGVFQVVANHMTLEGYYRSILNHLQFTATNLLQQWQAIAVAAATVLVLTLLYRAFGKITDFPNISPSFFLSLWSTVRFLIVSSILAAIAVTFAMYDAGLILPLSNADKMRTLWLQQIQSPPFLASLIACVGIIAALYYPPARSNMPRRLGFIRFILIVLAVIGVIGLYSTAPNRDFFLRIVGVTIIMMIAFLPAQRVYS